MNGFPILLNYSKCQQDGHVGSCLYAYLVVAFVCVLDTLIEVSEMRLDLCIPRWRLHTGTGLTKEPWDALRDHSPRACVEVVDVCEEDQAYH